MSALRRHWIVPIALALCTLGTESASAATTRFASPGGTTAPSACTAVASPCSLSVALGGAQAGDTLSLSAGTYDVQPLVLPLPLHWVATDPATRPVLTSSVGTTVSLTGSGSTFEGLEIDNTSTSGFALGMNADVNATVRSTVLKGPHCVAQPDGDQVAGELTIADSVLSGPVGRTCAELGPASILRRSVVRLTDGFATQTPPPAVFTEGLVEDTQIDGGLQLAAPTAVARRVSASGWTGIFGQGLVVDSVARAFGNLGAAVAVDTPRGGTLRVINVTAVATEAPAFEARTVVSPAGTTTASLNFLVLSDSIARGAPVDLRATTSPLTCPLGRDCDFGVIRIDQSNFVTRQPGPGEPGDTIQVGPGNQSGDPLFADLAAGDFHLRAGSPAIDAGEDPSGRTLPSDADGHPRVQGAAIDLGAFEFSPPSPGGTDGSAPPPSGTDGGSTATPPADTAAPTLGRLRVSRARFRAAAGTTLTTTTSEAGLLRVAVQRRLTGRRIHGRCVARNRSGTRCTRWVASGPTLSRSAVQPGPVKVGFSARLAARRLTPGHYRFVVNAIDGAGNRSASRTISFTVLPNH
jgi:hypothetical protein